MTRFRLVHHLRTSLWFVPVLCVIGGVILSFSTIAIDRSHDYRFVSSGLAGDPNAAIAILATVAASMVTLTGLVLTIVLVVVQLAMGQFSPRIVRSILHDRPSQIAIGVFVATFAHAMLAMREVHFANGGRVPGLAILVAYVLVVVSIVVLVLYIHHIGQSLRVAALIELVGRDTRRLLDRVYPDHGAEPEVDPGTVMSPRSGVVFRVDTDRLVALARDAGCTIALVPTVGEFVPAGAPLLRVTGDAGRLHRDRAIAAIALGPERTMNQDVAYGFRMLVDIAERSLSDSFDDPTTAVQAIDRLHDCLRQLARRPFPSGRHCDDEGELRLVVPTIDWDGYVMLAFEEVREAGSRSPQVTRRLRAALDDLLTVAPADRRPALERQLRRLDEAIGHAPDGLGDLDTARVPDRVGFGSGADVVADGDRPLPAART